MSYSRNKAILLRELGKYPSWLYKTEVLDLFPDKGEELMEKMFKKGEIFEITDPTYNDYDVIAVDFGGLRRAFQDFPKEIKRAVLSSELSAELRKALEEAERGVVGRKLEDLSFREMKRMREMMIAEVGETTDPDDIVNKCELFFGLREGQKNEILLFLTETREIFYWTTSIPEKDFLTIYKNWVDILNILDSPPFHTAEKNYLVVKEQLTVPLKNLATPSNEAKEILQSLIDSKSLMVVEKNEDFWETTVYASAF